MQNPRYKRFKATSFTPTIFYFVKPESLICKFPSIWPELPYLAPGYDPFQITLIRGTYVSHTSQKINFAPNTYQTDMEVLEMTQCKGQGLGCYENLKKY